MMRALLICCLFSDAWPGQRRGFRPTLKSTRTSDPVGSDIPGRCVPTRWYVVCVLGVLVGTNAIWLAV